MHYNSSQPAQLNALAYAQGTDIHVAPGQEKHLPYEAWHVVQQKQGRVQPTMQMKEGVAVNDDKEVEHEADVMGNRSLQMKSAVQSHTNNAKILNFFLSNNLIQRVVQLVKTKNTKRSAKRRDKKRKPKYDGLFKNKKDRYFEKLYDSFKNGDALDISELEILLERSIGVLTSDEIDDIEISMDRLKGSAPPSLNYSIKGDKYDLTYQGKQLRFTWPAGLRDTLINAQTNSTGQLICPHCGTQIILNNQKKEEWVSVNGTPKKTAPPIDHHNPSWKKRLEVLESKGLCVEEFSKQAKEQYVALPLRILHMKCNSSLGANH